MKSLILSFVFLFSFICFAKAEMPEETMPSIQNFVGFSKQSSVTAGALTDFSRTWISSYPAIFSSVIISSKGSADATLDVYNGISTSTAKKMIDTINTGFINPTDSVLAYDIYFSSAISINNRGTVPAKLTITYQTR